MLIRLHLLDLAELRALAASRIPEQYAARIAAGALPPAFVAQRALDALAAGKSAHWCATFLMLRAADRMVVGACGFKDIPAHGQVEIGYGVAPACRGQGIATAAVGALVRTAFADAQVAWVLAQIDPGNTASARVVAKLGFDAGASVTDTDGETLVQWTIRRGQQAALPH